VTIFYSLRFETSLFIAFYDSQGYGGGIGPRLHTGELSSTRKRVQILRVEAGSNISTVALRVVEGDEKGSLKSETIKYRHESHGILTRE
jgi:hypothetical protein